MGLIPFPYFIITTIADILVFYIVYYSIAISETVNIKLLVLALFLFVINRLVIKWQKNKNIDQINHVEPDFILPIDSDSPNSQLVSATFDPTGVVLFIDIDGVLHRNGTETFDRLELFNKILDQFPNLQIILSSTWRLSPNVDFFSSKTGALFFRIKGCTPHLIDYDKELEIQSFITNFNVSRFIIVDSSLSSFAGSDQYVVVTDGNGLNDNMCDQIIDKIRHVLDQ